MPLVERFSSDYEVECHFPARKSVRHFGDCDISASSEGGFFVIIDERRTQYLVVATGGEDAPLKTENGPVMVLKYDDEQAWRSGIQQLLRRLEHLPVEWSALGDAEGGAGVAAWPEVTPPGRDGGETRTVEEALAPPRDP